MLLDDLQAIKLLRPQIIIIILGKVYRHYIDILFNCCQVIALFLSLDLFEYSLSLTIFILLRYFVHNRYIHPLLFNLFYRQIKHFLRC